MAAQLSAVSGEEKAYCYNYGSTARYLSNTDLTHAYPCRDPYDSFKRAQVGEKATTRYTEVSFGRVCM